MNRYYRLLKIGEKMQKGDETLFYPSGTWNEIPATAHGNVFGYMHGVIRREMDVKFAVEYIAERIVK